MKRQNLFWNLVFFFLWVLIPQIVYSQSSQSVQVSGSPNPVGSGARALGMGGAFIGVADDATAASWNPGGLIQLETPEVSCVLSYDKLYEDRSFKVYADASGKYSVSLYDINYLSVAYPFNWLGRNMIVSLNYQTLYNFNKKHNYNYYYNNPAALIEGPRITNTEIDGYLKALSPAISVQITPTFSFGLALNWFHEDLGSEWDKDRYDYLDGIWNGTMISTLETIYYEKFKFKTSANPFGFKDTSYTIGFLWNINKYITLGGVFKPKFTAEVDWEYGFWSEQNIGGTIIITDPPPVKEDQELTMPASYGLGLACRFSDQFTMDLDVYRTDWQDLVLRRENGRKLSLFTGLDNSLTDTKPTHQVRLGGEYLFLLKNRYVVPVRGGVFYDPEPTEDDPDSFYGFSLGGGIAVESFVFDMAYQYRWGDGVRKVSLGTEDIYQDVKQHTIYTSVIWHF